MRLTSESISSGDQSWRGSAHGLRNGRTSTIVASNFTQSDHYPNGYLPAGLPLNVADEANVKPWTGGEGEVLGFNNFDQTVTDPAGSFAASIMRHGTVRVRRLPVAFTAPADAHFVFINGSDA